MTPRPNALGYIVLGTFVGLGIYALSRRGKTQTRSPVTILDCPLETPEDYARLESWGIERELGVITITNATPPSPDTERGRSFSKMGANLVVVTSDGSFWSYASGKPQPAMVLKEDYCNWVSQ